jgi:hypothetical protein
MYVENGHGKLRFHRVNAPNIEELRELVHAISHRGARFLEKRGFLERDADDYMDAGGKATHGAVAENSYLALETDDDDAMVQLQGHSITYRIGVKARQSDGRFVPIAVIDVSSGPATYITPA